MGRSAIIAGLVTLAGHASAGEVSVGLLGGVNVDLPDLASKSYARIQPGPSVMIPVRWHATEVVAVRGTARFDFASGTDRLTWSRWVDGADVRFADDQSAAVLGGFGASVGVELHLPMEWAVRPYGGAEIGLMGVGVWHTLGGESDTIYDVESGGSVGPYTMQAVLVTDVHAGARVPLVKRLSVWVELGYAASYLPAANLRKTRDELDARREAIGWNTFRAGAGLSISL